MVATFAQGDDVFYRSSPWVREPLLGVDGLLAAEAHPTMKIEECQMVNVVALSIDSPALRGVILASVSSGHLRILEQSNVRQMCS